MGVVRSTESLEAEVGELQRELRARKAEGHGWAGRDGPVGKEAGARDEGEHWRTVCVSSGLSFLGFAIVNCLLARGYSVRLALESQENLDKLREMEVFGEMGRDGVSAVVASVMDMDGLCAAFDGCVAVFHTSSFADPSGVSGYTKHMAEMEVTVAERVIEACVRTPSVRKCVFTSSLSACIWRCNSTLNRRILVDENSWSDETLCRDKKLWFALGKMMAEKAAWRAARGRNLKLVTLCPALVTGPGFCRRNSTASIAYLKGVQEMFVQGLLATVDVHKVADAHIRVYEEMDNTACGRYVCYDHIVIRGEEAAELERQLGIPSRICSETTTDHPILFELCNRKLSRLMSMSRHCSYDAFSSMYP